MDRRMLLDWQESHCVGIRALDEQHRRLAAQANVLHSAILDGRNREACRALRELIAGAGAHFATEERYFEQLGYPETEAHAAEHQRFLRQARAFERDAEEDLIALSPRLTAFLREWLASHIALDKEVRRTSKPAGGDSDSRH